MKRFMALLLVVAAVSWPSAHYTWEHDMTAMYWVSSMFAALSSGWFLIAAAFYLRDRRS